MEKRYYLSIFPMEAVIASQLAPEQFGSYMASGRKNGSYEKTAFIEIDGGFGDYFDWSHADERCVVHPNGDPKHSLWLSVYRCLEHVSLENLKSLYLATNDGRTLELQRSEPSVDADRPFWVYQEFCPVHPLVVSIYDPISFSEYMTHDNVKVSVPKIAFCDLKVIDFDNLENSGNIGSTYDTNIGHLKECIASVTGDHPKNVKNVERSRIESFGYQIINSGIFVGTNRDVVMYAMPPVEELRMNHYDWAKSAMIL